MRSPFLSFSKSISLQPKGEPLDEPIATNFGGAGDKGNPTLSDTIDMPAEPEIEKY
ncbi:hypothetical protein [Leptolyngbya sp. FACHB-261]|uniref:hypothetical protein n=1 Tax=Leptolyngbya sp. FACHB-261 TaxID=2692806 RepID=UPI0016898AEB|nr:hypothetical protein [Leptolyngbya sp. FACHB-261]MBD2101922.1 hypothetical protein [Leptolyngbya sp. FACHB-261]